MKLTPKLKLKLQLQLQLKPKLKLHIKPKLKLHLKLQLEFKFKSKLERDEPIMMQYSLMSAKEAGVSVTILRGPWPSTLY